MRNLLNLAISAMLVGSVIAYPRSAEGVSVATIGGWNTTVGVSDLTERSGGAPKSLDVAGGQLRSGCRSAPDQMRLEVSGSRGRWKVHVRKGDGDWPDAFVLKLRKTSGTGSQMVVVGDVDKEFFSGVGDGVHNVQVILEGASAAIPAGTYTTTLVFTVTDE